MSLMLRRWKFGLSLRLSGCFPYAVSLGMVRGMWYHPFISLVRTSICPTPIHLKGVVCFGFAGWDDTDLDRPHCKLSSGGVSSHPQWDSVQGLQHRKGQCCTVCPCPSLQAPLFQLPSSLLPALEGELGFSEVCISIHSSACLMLPPLCVNLKKSYLVIQ